MMQGSGSAIGDQGPDLARRVRSHTGGAFAQDVDHGGHAVHDRAINFQVLFDQLEWQFVHGEPGSRWDSRSWIGGDRNRIWVRTEGDAVDGILDTAEAQVLFGRSITRWWDVVAGVRFDARPSPSHTWAALGVQGTAPMFFDVQATAFVGESGHLAARLEVEYDLLLTQRLVLQPLVELSLAGANDPDRGIGAGLSTGEVGFRVRYEIRRELAPVRGRGVASQAVRHRRRRPRARRRRRRLAPRQRLALLVLAA